MKRKDQRKENHSDTDTKKSCPTVLQEDVTRSLNEQCYRNAKSQQFLPHEEDYILEENQSQKRQSQISAMRISGFGEKPQLESKIDVKIINQRGTDFDCEKVESLELSIEQISYQSGSLRNRSNRNSQKQIEEPRSGKKSKRSEKQKPHDIEYYRQNDLKQDVLNVLLAGSQDTGKSRFKQCFKGKQRKYDEPHIKNRTRQIKYEQAMVDQNLLNRRNTVCFIDLPGFASNEEDKYVRQIQQYAMTQWRNFQIKPDEDRRIHCCLYFIRGPRIKHSDINMIKKLSAMFNLIPVIAKSDHYKKEQILEMKDQFHRKIAAAGQIELYDLEQFYLLKLGTDRIKEALHSSFGKIPPFAIATSTDRQSPQSANLVRKYAWGKLEVQNQEHTDFKRLCDFLTSDVRTQFLAKLVPLHLRIQQESVQEVMGSLGSEIENEQRQNECFWTRHKDLIVLGSLFAAVGGVFLYPKLKQVFPVAAK